MGSEYSMIKKTSPTRPKISVVIAGHNRPDSLRETLKALREQTLASKDYEIIVVGYTQTSLKEVADENAKLAKHSFTYKEIGTRWPDAKRNEGIRLAQGKYVAFTDDDVLPQKDWLKKIVESFKKNPDAVGIEGLTDGDNTPLLSHATKNKHGGEYPTCNIAFTKEVLEKVGGFDEAYHFFREDTDIAYHVLQHGKIVFDQNVNVFHPTRRITPDSVLRELGMTRGEIRLAKKFPKKYAQKYGVVGRGGWLQAIFSWTIILAAAWLSTQNDALAPLVAVAAVAVLFAFRIGVSFRGRTATFEDSLNMWFYMLARDLAYPFFFTYFWLTENPKVVEIPSSK